MLPCAFGARVCTFLRLLAREDERDSAQDTCAEFLERPPSFASGEEASVKEA